MNDSDHPESKHRPHSKLAPESTKDQCTGCLCPAIKPLRNSGAGEISGPRKIPTMQPTSITVSPAATISSFLFSYFSECCYMFAPISVSVLVFCSVLPDLLLCSDILKTEPTSTYPKYLQNSEYTLPYSHLNEVGAVLESGPNSVVGLLTPADTVTHTTIHSAAGQNARVISCLAAVRHGLPFTSSERPRLTRS
jgi:hypothetical protein